ncbi:MAG: hypothetical protein AAB604_00525 [Patescibacteria group bacterium]
MFLNGFMNHLIIAPLQKIITGRRVARGALYYDRILDDFWFKFINGALIDMTDESKSVYGQWEQNVPLKKSRKMKIRNRVSRLQRPHKYGLVIDRRSPAELLNHAWMKEIEKRRNRFLTKEQKHFEGPPIPRPVGKFLTLR